MTTFKEGGLQCSECWVFREFLDFAGSFRWLTACLVQMHGSQLSALIYAVCICIAAVHAQTWTKVPVTGTAPPTALYGASGVWYPATSSLYVFGGMDATFASSLETYILQYKGGAGVWTRMVAARGLYPVSRYLHSATFDGVQGMIVVGGLTNTPSASSAASNFTRLGADPFYPGSER